MAVDEYLEHHQQEKEMADSKQISSVLDSEAETWYRVHWRHSEKLFLFWYIWLKDDLEVMMEWVEEMKTNLIKPDQE